MDSNFAARRVRTTNWFLKGSKPGGTKAMIILLTTQQEPCYLVDMIVKLMPTYVPDEPKMLIIGVKAQTQ
eukprot:scaffold131630_cov20-Prasinocladus_malaysianus.AAC.1